MAEKIYCTDDRKKDMSKTLNLCQMIGRITGYLKVHCISDYTENKTWTKKTNWDSYATTWFDYKKMQQFQSQLTASDYHKTIEIGSLTL